MANVELRPLAEPFSSEQLDVKDLLMNLNRLLGYFHNDKDASLTIWHAEQLIKEVLDKGSIR